MKDFLYDIEFKHNDKQYIYNTLTSSLIELDLEAYQKYTDLKNKINYDTLNSENNAFLKELKLNGFLIDKDEQSSILDQRLSQSKNPSDTLSLTLVPTLNCNLNCIYCFQENNKSEEYKLFPDDLTSFIELFDISNLHINWFGGEPTLKYNQIMDLTNTITKYAKQNNINFTFSIVTNGLLLDEDMIDDFISVGITNIQLTLDGLRETHNKRKNVDTSKYDNFENIMNIIKNSKEQDISISIRINIDKTNYNEVKPLINLIEPHNHSDLSINFAKIEIFTDVNNNLHETIFTSKEFSEIELELYKYLIEKNMIQDIDILYPYAKANYCGATELNSFAITYTGDIYKCWCDMEYQNKSIGNIRTLKNINFKDNFFLQFSALEDEKCKLCNMLPLCWGGCLKYRRDNNPTCPEIKENLIKQLELILDYEQQNTPL